MDSPGFTHSSYKQAAMPIINDKIRFAHIYKKDATKYLSLMRREHLQCSMFFLNQMTEKHIDFSME